MSTAKLQAFEPDQHGGRSLGVGIVIGVHILIGAALASGLGKEMVAAIKKPLQAVVLQEVLLPPPPPPPKPLQTPKQVEQASPETPPPYVPPTEVPVSPSAEAPVLQSSPTPPPAPQPIAAPPSPTPAPVAPAKVDLTVACPTQVQPELPARAQREGISGTVRAQATIIGGVVSQVEILSGPRLFHAAVREAMQKYRCTAPDGTVATQVFNFRVE